MNAHRRRSRLVSRLFLTLFLCSLPVVASHTVRGEGGRVISFPLPPDPEAIGTQTGAISTYVSRVTLSPPASVHRLGLTYLEIRGTIQGVGWGGSTAGLLQCPYTYELPYVLRIPPDWSGGLTIYRHQFDPATAVQPWELAFGDRSFYRVIHESGDRAVADAALHPNRRWAFFSVNTSGVAPGGGYNTTLLDAGPSCVGGTPASAGRDTTIARDHALLAQRLLKILRGREVTLTLGVGFVQGAVVNFSLDAGYRHPADPTKAGDNHRVPYVPGSGRIFDGFIWIDGMPASSLDLSALSAPTFFVYGDIAGGANQAAINQLSRIAATAGINPLSMARAYSIRNMPLLDADGNLSLTREDVDWAYATLPGDPVVPPVYFLGSGERTRPVMGALLDALAAWATTGVPPVPSLFNGEVKTAPDRVEFFRTGAPSLSFPYVDDVTLDTLTGNSPTTPSAALRAAWANARASLGATAGSIVLPETACRRGGFRFAAGLGPVGGDFELFEEPAFNARWGSAAAYNHCRVQTLESLAASGLYDSTFAAIDIDPDHSPNVIDLSSTGWLTVAIFSTSQFDATEVVPGSLRLAGASQRGFADNPGGTRTQAVDLNGDGRTDMRVEFRIDRLTFSDIDIVADVWGQTRGGTPFQGSDLVTLMR